MSGYNHVAKEQTGVQCKKRKNKFNGVTAPSSSLTTDEIDEVVNAARSFVPRLQRFVIATTGLRDSALQEHVRILNAASPSFKVSLWFWDDYVEFLNSNDNLMYRYYENVLRYRQRYSKDEHFLRLLALAFDRPAIRTAFHLENRATDFIEAIASLQQLVATGILKDRTGHLVDEARPPGRPVPELKRIKRLLDRIRTEATEAMQKGIIIEHETVIEIRDRAVQVKLNDLRSDVVASLNQLLTAANIDAIEVRGY